MTAIKRNGKPDVKHNVNGSVNTNKKEIIVVGSGLAGMSAAIAAVEEGCHVTLLSRTLPERAQSVMAAGGINAAMDTKGQDDGPDQHAADTLAAGQYLADPQAVADLAAGAPDIIRWMERLGVLFSRDAQGRVDLRYFGGQKKMRTAYARSGIGRQLVTGLSQRLHQLEAAGCVTFIPDADFLAGVFDDGGRCGGCVFRRGPWGAPEVLPAQGVILAAGAPGQLFPKTTGAVTSSGQAAAALFRQGVAMANLEMIQYHPTTVDIPAKRLLISESARGEGGRLWVPRNGEPWYFMEDWYPERGNLMPRDVVSQSIWKVCHQYGLGLDGGEQVNLDVSFLPDAILEDNLAEILDLSRTYLNIDPKTRPIPVYPGIHYFMGGIWVDACHRTDRENLYAAGECACQYHGANRLGGNSTLGAIYGGRVAGTHAARYAGSGDPAAAAQAAARWLKKEATSSRPSAAPGAPDTRARVHAVMDRVMGIYREGPELEQGLAELMKLTERLGQPPAGPFGGPISGPAGPGWDARSWEDGTMALLAQGFVASALNRQESRGAHQRRDYPDKDPQWQAANVVRCNGRDLLFERMPVDGRRAGVEMPGSGAALKEEVKVQ